MIVALDVGSREEARHIVAALGEAASFYKIGMELVFGGGLSLVAELADSGKRVFLDMKLLDIDNTVGAAIRNIAALGATLTTVHAYPGAMQAAVAARSTDGPGLLAVTVLTSMGDDDLRRAGYAFGAAELVRRRAGEAREAGVDGIVCSPREASLVRNAVGPEMVIVTPGIRPVDAAKGDQKRVATPGEAIAAGADYLVVGRPIVAAREPRRAAEAIAVEIEAALAGMAA
jgi:orotidine-5'-phosphate decarboxylase